MKKLQSTELNALPCTPKEVDSNITSSYQTFPKKFSHCSTPFPVLDYFCIIPNMQTSFLRKVFRIPCLEFYVYSPNEKDQNQNQIVDIRKDSLIKKESDSKKKTFKLNKDVKTFLWCLTGVSFLVTVMSLRFKNTLNGNSPYQNFPIQSPPTYMRHEPVYDLLKKDLWPKFLKLPLSPIHFSYKVEGLASYGQQEKQNISTFISTLSSEEGRKESDVAPSVQPVSFPNLFLAKLKKERPFQLTHSCQIGDKMPFLSSLPVGSKQEPVYSQEIEGRSSNQSSNQSINQRLPLVGSITSSGLNISRSNNRGYLSSPIRFSVLNNRGLLLIFNSTMKDDSAVYKAELIKLHAKRSVDGDIKPCLLEQFTLRGTMGQKQGLIMVEKFFDNYQIPNVKYRINLAKDGYVAEHTLSSFKYDPLLCNPEFVMSLPAGIKHPKFIPCIYDLDLPPWTAYYNLVEYARNHHNVPAGVRGHIHHVIPKKNYPPGKFPYNLGKLRESRTNNIYVTAEMHALLHDALLRCSNTPSAYVAATGLGGNDVVRQKLWEEATPLLLKSEVRNFKQTQPGNFNDALGVLKIIKYENHVKNNRSNYRELTRRVDFARLAYASQTLQFSEERILLQLENEEYLASQASIISHP